MLTKIFQTNGKLVAAPAPRKISDSQVLVKAIRYLAQQLVTDVVPQRVIDRLETIKVDEQNCQRPLAALTAADCFFELLREKPAIRKHCQIIVLCALLELDGSAHDVGNVTECDDATDQRMAAVVQALAVDAQYRVGLTRCPIYCSLAGKLLASAGFDKG